MALGATAHSVRAMIVRDGMTLVAGGIVVGAPVALWALRMMQPGEATAPAYGLRATGIAIAVFLMLGLIACLVPARRACRIAPANVLRSE